MQPSVKIEKNIVIPKTNGIKRRDIAHNRHDGLPVDQARIKQALTYDPEIGRFTWNEGHGASGKLAGSICRRFGYRHITIYGRRCAEHRLAWIYTHGIIKPHHHICHRNGVRDDNRIENLSESKNTHPFRVPSPPKPRKPKIKPVDKMGEILEKSRARMLERTGLTRKEELLAISNIMSYLWKNELCKNNSAFSVNYLGQCRSYWGNMTTRNQGKYRGKVSLEALLHLHKRLMSMSDIINVEEQCSIIMEIVDKRIVLNNDLYTAKSRVALNTMTYDGNDDL